MSLYQICKKTVMDTSDPDIKFDDEGLSNHYLNFQKKIKPYWNPNEQSIKNLYKKINQIKLESKSKDYSCILGLSGGIDSSYLLHILVNDFNIKPLVFHVDAGWNSEEATHNINSLVNKLNLDLYTEVIDWDEMKNFQIALLKSGVPHIDIPQDMAFISMLYKFANKYNIKYIMNGGNVSSESVLMPLKYFYWGTDMLQVKDILNKFGSSEMKTYPFISIYYHKIFLRYFKGIKVLKPLNSINYQVSEAIKILKEKYDFRTYSQKHFESKFTKFYEGYWLPKRFQYDVRRNQYSSLILSGQMKRETAIQNLKTPPLSYLETKNEIEYVSNKLEISIEELSSFLELPKKYYWDYKNQKIIFDLGEKILFYLTKTIRGGAL